MPRPRRSDFAGCIYHALKLPKRLLTPFFLFNDGSLFSFDLNPIESYGNDFFASGATLTVTVASVPEPSSALALLGLGGLTMLRRRRTA